MQQFMLINSIKHATKFAYIFRQYVIEILHAIFSPIKQSF